MLIWEKVKNMFQFQLDNKFPQTVVTYVYKMVGHTLSYASSCINPFVYSFLGDGFRKALRKAFPRVYRNKVLWTIINHVNIRVLPIKFLQIRPDYFMDVKIEKIIYPYKIHPNLQKNY